MGYNRRNKLFFIRLLFVYSLHLIIKWGDETFHGFFDFTWRGIYFSIYVISLWMFALYLLDYLKKNFFSHRRNIFLYIFFHFVYGYIFALLTNLGYRYADTNYYKTYWNDIGYFNPTLVFGILAIFISIVGFYEYFQTELRSKENQLLTEKLKKENAIAHYKLLKAQIQPHFLFNSLSVLNSLVYKDEDLASGFIVRLSKILRYSIEQNDKMYISLGEEVDFMNNYCFLMKNRFKDAINLYNHIDNNLLNTTIVPPSTLQILLENAIKHNIFNENNPLIISLRNDAENIYIENNLNFKSEDQDTTGIGIINLSKRFQLLCGKKISIDVLGKQFRVTIPIIKKTFSHAGTYI